MKTFNFADLKDIRPSLLKLRCPLRPPSEHKVAIHHLEMLDELARELKVCSSGLQNARRLANGYEDLVVVLIEPTDKAEEVPYEEMLAASETLLCVDEALQFASGSQRNIENTIILDIRAFRSNFIRTSQGLKDRNRDDELAYDYFERIMSVLRPRVVVVCQCVTNEANNKFVQGLCSSVKRAGDINLQQLPNRHECLLVKSFHPMHYKRSKDCALKRAMLEYLFDTTFIIALNALAGDRISGMGLKNLRNCAQDGPAVIFAPEGIYISYQWVSGGNVASNKLLKQMQSIEKPLDEIDQVLTIYKRTEWVGSSLCGLPLKGDILDELGENIEPLPPKQPIPYDL